MEIISELKELNLDENEIRVYLSCLSLGSSKVNEISRKSELIRTTCYGVLKSLIEKGLISTILVDNVTHFQATSPKQLVSMLEEKRKKIISILPQLEGLSQSINTTHKVQLFEGKEGLKTVFNDLVSKKNEEIRIIGFLNKWLSFSESYSDIYYRKKKENHITARVLVDDSEKDFAKNKKIGGSDIKFIKDLDIDSECFIYQDKIAFVSFEENNLKGVIIQDKQMNKLQSLVFDNLWKIAKP